MAAFILFVDGTEGVPKDSGRAAANIGVIIEVSDCARRSLLMGMEIRQEGRPLVRADM